MTREQLISELTEAQGAILYWQLPKDAVESAVADGVAYLDDDSDLLILKDAVKDEDGAYHMPSIASIKDSNT
jgi:hypothetical protein